MKIKILKRVSTPPSCPMCFGETEWDGGNKYRCFFCGYAGKVAVNKQANLKEDLR